MEVALEWDPSFDEGRGEMLALLAEFTEMPDEIKLYYLSKLMHKDQNKAKEREEFKKILSSLPAELVSLLASIGMSYLFLGEHHQCTRERKSSARCCGYRVHSARGQKELCQNSAGIWVATIFC